MKLTRQQKRFMERGIEKQHNERLLSYMPNRTKPMLKKQNRHSENKTSNVLIYGSSFTYVNPIDSQGRIVRLNFNSDSNQKIKMSDSVFSATFFVYVMNEGSTVPMVVRVVCDSQQCLKNRNMPLTVLQEVISETKDLKPLDLGDILKDDSITVLMKCETEELNSNVITDLNDYLFSKKNDDLLVITNHIIMKLKDAS